MGAGRPKAAKLAALVVLLVAVIEGLLLSGIAVAVRNVWGYIYTNKEEVVKYLAAIMPVLALSNFMDGIQGVLSGQKSNCLKIEAMCFVIKQIQHYIVAQKLGTLMITLT